jgi:cytochrome c oxidase subunit 4
MAHPTVSPRTYVLIYVTLISLTLLTAFLGVRAHLGIWELPVAMAIAATKTVLVGLFFMHLVHSNWLTWLVILAGVVFFGVMLMLTWADYWTRGLVQ